MRNLNNYSINYAEYQFEDIQASYRKRKILELMQLYDHKHILEVGCGLAPLFMESQDFDNMVVIEPAQKFYNNAKTLIEDKINNSKVTILNNTLENSINELTTVNFDFILVSGLLHELENASIFLDKLHFLLNKNTVVHVNVPNAYSFHRLLAFEMGLIPSVFEMSDSNKIFEQKTVFDLTSLSELITTHGYKIINSGSYFIKPFTHKQMATLLKTNMIDNKTLEGLFNMTKYMPGLGSEIFVEFRLINNPTMYNN